MSRCYSIGVISQANFRYKRGEPAAQGLRQLSRSVTGSVAIVTGLTLRVDGGLTFGNA